MDSDRNQEIEVQKLQELVDCLQKENRQLKDLLEMCGRLAGTHIWRL